MTLKILYNKLRTRKMRIKHIFASLCFFMAKQPRTHHEEVAAYPVPPMPNPTTLPYEQEHLTVL